MAGAGLTSDPRSVPILYATNRAVKNQDKQEFTGEFDTKVHYGYAYVRVPETHRFGQPPNWSPSDDTFINNSDETRLFVIRRKEALSKEEFAQRIKASRAKNAIIYVHGFNTSFDESLVTFAQILYDGQLNDFIPVLFSWPTMGGVLDYERDGEIATDSVPALEALIKSLQDDCGVDNVNIIAHSMGNRVVVDAPANLSSLNEIHSLNELVMAAADVDKNHFAQKAELIEKAAKGITLYASSSDKALGLSGFIARGERLGKVGPDGPFTYDGLDSIDVSEMGDDAFSTNHSTYATGPLVEDMARIIRFDTRPPADGRPE